MSAASPATLSNTQNPVEAFHARLIERLLLVVRPRNPGSFWNPSDFQSLAQYIRDIVEVNDDFIREIGDLVAANSYRTVDTRSFDEPLMSALDGNALYVIESCADHED